MKIAYPNGLFAYRRLEINNNGHRCSNYNPYYKFSIPFRRLQSTAYRVVPQKLAIKLLNTRFKLFARECLLHHCKEEITLCAYCDEEIGGIGAGDESWSYCDGCQQIEGETYQISNIEYEQGVL